MPSVTLILGGAASGKSVVAEKLIADGFGRRYTGATYVATATPGDREMAARIQRHRERRGPQWVTIEEPLALADTVREHADPARPILVDCLTLWLTNLLADGFDAQAEATRVVEALPSLAGPVLFVTNEVGLGIVPANALARNFRDQAGRLNQAFAAAADKVYFVAAGLPLTLK